MAWTNQSSSSSAGGGGVIRFSEGALLTPSGGAITPTDSFHHVAAGTVSSIATTNFDTSTINLLLLEADGNVTITPGASLVAKTTSLVDNDVILFKLEGTVWSEVATTADVTLTGTQTLTNKTIALGSNTVSGTIAQFNTALTDADFATLAGTETLSGKTLTTPTINDLRGISRMRGVNTLAPVVTATGFGASPTIALSTGSSDLSGRINITVGGAGPAASGTITITFSTGSAYGTNGCSPLVVLANGDGTWNARATCIGSATNSTTSSIWNWDNNSTNVTNAATYAFHYWVPSR